MLITLQMLSFLMQQNCKKLQILSSCLQEWKWSLESLNNLLYVAFLANDWAKI